MEKKDDKVSKEIIQSRLITNSRNEFSLLEKRILYRIFETAQAELKGQKLEGNIYTGDDLWGNKNIYLTLSAFYTKEEESSRSQLKSALHSLLRKVAEIKYPDGGWKMLHYLNSAEFNVKKQQYCLEVDKTMWQAFLNFSEGYSKYQLTTAMSFKSVYSCRFYEMLHNNIEPMRYSIEWIRDRFMLKKKYINYTQFKDRVIMTAVNEINEKSDISVTFIENKGGKGKKVESITFFVEKKSIDPLKPYSDIAHNNNRTSPVVNKDISTYLQEQLGFKPKEVLCHRQLLAAFVHKNGIDKAIDILARIKTDMLRYEIRNKKAYLIVSIRNEMGLQDEKIVPDTAANQEVKKDVNDLVSGLSEKLNRK